MNIPSKILLLILVLNFTLLGCFDAAGENGDEGGPLAPARATLAPLSTLVPTFTPLPAAHLQTTVTPAAVLAETAVDPTPTINFEEPTLQLVYRIPALSLDRQLEGNISSQITVIDQTIPLGMQRSNQGSILLDLQRKLPEVDLQPLPEGCDTCVYLQYSLPQIGESREGWLQDPVFLASVENYMTALVGPHFPPGTVVGLRREATFYYPAHSIALMADGRIYTWFATEAQVDEPFATPLSFTDILASLPLAELENIYAVNCLPEPVETMRFYTTGQPLEIAIRCPAYALPTTLLPLYAQLDQIMAEKLATYDGPERPPTGLPLAAVLDYKRLDGNQLTLSYNGRVTIQNNGQLLYTGTMTTTEIISLTTDLLNNGQLEPGLTTLLENETANNTPTASQTVTPASVLLVRGPEGILDGKFDEIELPFLSDLNALLDSLLMPPETAETPTPEIEITPEPDQPTATPSL